MKRCTICGATSREGARFCTSCGARLEESGSTPVEATAVQPAVTPSARTSGEMPTPDADGTDQPPAPDGGRDLESGWPEATGSSTPVAASSEIATSDTAPDVPDARDASAPQWPGMDASGTSDQADTTDETDTAERRDDRDGDDVMAAFTTRDRDGTPADPDIAAAETRDAEDEHDIPADPQRGPSDWEGWSQHSSESDLDTPSDDTGRDARDTRDAGDGAEARVVSAPAPRSFATDAYQDPAGSRDTDRDSLSGSTTPWVTASGEGDDVAGDDVAGDADAYALLDRLRVRIDRLSDPASLADRGIDPDDLADQLDRWRRTVPDADALLEAVKAARRSPRDIDTLLRMADVAPDLELLVRHYQSITEQSATWAESLRGRREG